MLPIPPFWKLFSRSERVVMALIYECQLNGVFLNSEIKLAKEGEARALPRPYGRYCLGDMQAKFPFDEYSPEGAEHLIDMMVDTKDTLPKDIGQWIELLEAGRDIGHENEEEHG